MAAGEVLYLPAGWFHEVTSVNHRANKSKHPKAGPHTARRHISTSTASRHSCQAD